MATDAGGMNEEETCRTFVLPALSQSGWTRDQIRPQFRINDGRLTPTPKRHVPGDPLIADYVLEYAPDLPIGVVEAKRYRIDAANGVEQARRYAKKLGLPFAYATNGQKIIEIDFRSATPTIKEVDCFPSPQELWDRFLGDQQADSDLGRQLLTAPYDHSLRNSDNTSKRPRYYQRIAVNRTLAAIAREQKRILLVLATGTGKTMVALQTVAKLHRSQWIPGRKPRVLYLADRTMLVDDPKDKYFIPVFGQDDVAKLGGGEPTRGRKIYFALYQSMERGDEEALFEKYSRDYFDLIIVDECHRGSARDDSQWRRVLEYFSPATQIGLTATPISRKDADTVDYFGEPVYTYSLADGIEDGFLAPYRVRRVRLNVDMEGYQTEPGQRDTRGVEIEEKVYGPKEFERVMVILERTEAVAQYVIDYLRSTAEDGKHGKTIVFCENNDHAARMRDALFNLASAEINAGLRDYVVRITDADGPHGRAHLDDFRKDNTDEPVIAVTSKLLNTGIDLPVVRNIVLFRRIASISEFKQTIGRGTRLCPEIGKGSFDIIDFVEATRLFNDPGFDGPPLRVLRDTADEDGHVVDTMPETPDGQAVDPEIVAEPEGEYEQEDGGSFGASRADGAMTDPDEVDRVRARGRRYVVRGVEIYIWGERHYQLDANGSMNLVTVQQFVHDRVIELDLAPATLRSRWAAAKSRKVLMAALGEWHIDTEKLPSEFGNPDVDPVDLLLNVAWGLPLVSREERLYRFLHEHREFLESFQPEAREVLDEMLLKFAEHGSPQLKPETLGVPPFTELGSVVQLAERFGGALMLHKAIDELGRRLLEAG